jgi:hypothetical protein
MSIRKFAVIILIAVVAGIYLGHQVHAQTPSTYTIVHNGTLANCAPVVSGQTQTCFPVDGLAVSLKGAPYVLLPLTVTPTGVTSFNGRTGAVVPAASDYTFAQLAAPPTSVSCGSTGCVIK